MPFFTRCNIGLGSPQNVSVKFQPKLPNKSFIITAGKCHCLGVSTGPLTPSSALMKLTDKSARTFFS